MTQDAPFIHNT